MGLDVHVGRPRVAYKETILSSGSAEGRFVRQTGGRGQFAVVELTVEPFTPESDEDPITFINASKGGVVPREYIASVEYGVRDAASSGPLAGYPMLNVKATLVDGKDHPIDSSDTAFQQAGAIAFGLAVRKATPTLLEPIMQVAVTTPEEYLGAITGDLNSRRAEIKSMEHRVRFRVIVAHVPLGEMFGYATQLRSLTQGRATSTMSPQSYAAAPTSVTEDILRYA
jgi:elongation factor G